MNITRNPSSRVRSRRRQRGVTLVELMIAMVLGLVLTAGVIRIFIGNRTTYEFNESLSWIQESARFAVDHVASHTRMAGYTGCLAGVGVTNHLDGAANDFRDDLAAGLRGYDFDGTGADEDYAAGAVDPTPLADPDAWTPELPDELGDVADPHVLPGSDVLVVRYVSGESVPLVAPFSTATQLLVAPGHGFEAGQVLVATDCQKASLFQLTDVAAAGANQALVHGPTAGFTPGNDTGSWGAQEGYGFGAEVAAMQTVAFYVGQGENGAPSLFQLRLARTDGTTSALVHEELVQGVDTMQIRYGVDTNDDRQIDAWQTADVVEGASDWAAVLSVEISLLLRGVEEYGTEIDSAVYDVGTVEFDPVDDRRLRQIFTTTVGLRNRLP